MFAVTLIANYILPEKWIMIVIEIVIGIIVYLLLLIIMKASILKKVKSTLSR